MFTAALVGFAFGFVGSMPVAGPIAILVFGRGLQDRSRSALFLAMGSALVESVYAYLAFWGFSELLNNYPWIQHSSRALAAVILTALGIRLSLRRKLPEEKAEPIDPRVGSKRSFFLGMTITALNPTLIATWGAAVAMLHSLDIMTFGAARALPFSVGVGVGICGWFAVLLYALARFKNRFQRATLERTLRVMGVALVVLGLYFAWRFVTGLQDAM